MNADNAQYEIVKPFSVILYLGGIDITQLFMISGEGFQREFLIKSHYFCSHFCGTYRWKQSQISCKITGPFSKVISFHFTLEALARSQVKMIFFPMVSNATSRHKSKQFMASNDQFKKQYVFTFRSVIFLKIFFFLHDQLICERTKIKDHIEKSSITIFYSSDDFRKGHMHFLFGIMFKLSCKKFL